MILKEMDEDFSEDELDEIIAEVWISLKHANLNINKNIIPDRYW